MFGIRWHVNALSSWPSFVQAHFAGIAPRDPRAREGKRPQNNVFVHDRRTVWLMLESQNRDARRPEWQYLNSSVVC